MRMRVRPGGSGVGVRTIRPGDGKLISVGRIRNAVYFVFSFLESHMRVV